MTKQIMTKADEATIMAALKAAIEVHEAKPIMVKSRLKKLSKAQLKELVQYWKHDKSTASVKVSKLSEHMEEFVSMSEVNLKLQVSMEMFATNFAEAGTKSFADDSENFKAAKLLMFLKGLLEEDDMDL